MNSKQRVQRYIGAAVALVSLVALAACGSDVRGVPDPDDPIIVSFVEGLDVFPYEVVTVATEKGYFGEVGIEPEIIHTENEMQAIASDGADFAVGGTLAVLQATDSGIEARTIFSSMEGLGMNAAFSNAIIEEKGLSLEQPLEERIRALEGETIGLTAPLGDDEVFFRYFLRQAGLDPDNDVEFAYIGGTPDRITAMGSGQIAAYMSSIPAAAMAEDRGAGQRMIVPSLEKIEGLAGIPYSGIHVMQRFAEENPEVVEAVVSALAKAANFMRDNHDETVTIIENAYPELNPEVVRNGMEAVFPAIPESGRMAQPGWDRLRDAGAAAGVVEADRDVSEGVAWTNQYIPE